MKKYNFSAIFIASILIFSLLFSFSASAQGTSGGSNSSGGSSSGGGSSSAGSTSSNTTGGDNSGSDAIGNNATGGDESGSFNGNGSDNSSLNSYPKGGGAQFLKPIEDELNQFRIQLNGANLKLANRYMSGIVLSGTTLQLRDGYLEQLRIVEQYMYKNNMGTGEVNPINFIKLRLQYKYMLYENLNNLEQNIPENQVKVLNNYIIKFNLKYKNLTGSNAKLKYENLLSTILAYKEKINSSTITNNEKERIINILQYLEILVKGKIEDLSN